MSKLYHLPAGHTLTVSVVDGKAHVQQRESVAVAALVTNAAARSFGPYLLPRSFVVSGVANVVIAESDKAAEWSATTDLISAIPTEDPEDGVTVWNDAGVLKVASTV